jgi:hypothetical protein
MNRGTLLVVLVVLCIFGNAACGGGSIFGRPGHSDNFTFYAIGEDIDAPVYCVAGVVSIANRASKDGTFAVTGGVQDYNNGDTITSPQPSGDTITGGALSLGTNGTAILTVVTNNPAVGVDGTETFALVFPNASHALIIQFDGTATSSGSVDLQTATSVSSGSYAFTTSGAVSEDGDVFVPTAFGGVLTVASGTVSATADSNVGGAITIGTAVQGVTLGNPNKFGRGTVNGLVGSSSNSINYYVVGPRVIRVIDVDSATFDTAVGSAYSQGPSPNFSSGSIGQSVFSFSNSFNGYAAAGQFFTFEGDAAKPAKTRVVREGGEPCSGVSTCFFEGVGDLNELLVGDPIQLVASDVEGFYQLPASGYGTLTFEEGFGDTANFGLYAVDPMLNILDPNDTTDTTGGALVAEMDEALVGTGSVVPQSDIVVADFSGNYAGGGSGNSTDFTSGDEFDFLTLASVTEPDGTFNGIAALSDPFEALTDSETVTTDNTLTGTAVPDEANPGRYDINPLVLASPEIGSINMTVGVYQASGNQLFWVETDSDTYFGGSLEQFPNSGADAKKEISNATNWQH